MKINVSMYMLNIHVLTPKCTYKIYLFEETVLKCSIFLKLTRRIAICINISIVIRATVGIFCEIDYGCLMEYIQFGYFALANIRNSN